MRYSPIVAPEMLKKWKVEIISVGQGYKFTESRNEYRTEMLQLKDLRIG